MKSNNPFLDLSAEYGRKKDADTGVRVFKGLYDPSDPFYDPRRNWGMEFTSEDYELMGWIEDVHDKFKGERCFMLGSGPSLIDQAPLLKALNHEYVFTCNRAHKWKEHPVEQPFVHCVSEPGPLVAWGAGVGSIYDWPNAQNKVACIWTRVTAPGWLWQPKAPDDVQIRWQGSFGLDGYLPPVPTAWASPLTMTQLAMWMGFERVYILGSEITQMGQAWDRQKGTTKYPRNIRSIVECSMRLTRDVWRGGREVWDCTPGGRLNVEGGMPYKELEEVLDS